MSETTEQGIARIMHEQNVGRATAEHVHASEKRIEAMLHPHYVTVTPQYREGTELTPEVTFECRADAGAECRVYPACSCDSWDVEHGEDHGDGHEPVPHKHCWLQGWFDSPCHVYDGEEYDDMGDYGLPPGFDRSGPITATYSEDSVEWHFTEDDAA